jgi:hypothetical protein
MTRATRKRTSNKKNTLKNNVVTHLFTMYVNDEYTAKKMMILSNKLGKKLRSEIQMKWQWVKDGEKEVVACDFYKYD